MTDYEIYTYILCAVVFVLLVALAAICITWIVKITVKLIRCGGSDAQIEKEYQHLNRNKCCFCDKCLYILSILICVVFVAAAAFSIYLNFVKQSVSDTIPTLRVVQSQSMSEKLESNTYLTENDLNDQFDMFDVVLTYKMPDEYDLELYDVVVYEQSDGTPVIHRIIAIEEPNGNHPDCRYFTLRGDNVSYSDSTSITYNQMLGIYRGERIRYVGSFIMFLQSPAGWLCILLIVGMVVLSPILENYIGKAKARRYRLMLKNRQKQETAAPIAQAATALAAAQAPPAVVQTDTASAQAAPVNKVIVRIVYRDRNTDEDGFYEDYDPNAGKKRRTIIYTPNGDRYNKDGFYDIVGAPQTYKGGDGK